MLSLWDDPAILVIVFGLTSFAVFALFQTPQVKSWDRVPAPGLLFRMEVESNPSRTIYGLRIDPKVYRLESRLAGDKVYEAGKTNGRGTVTAMTDSFGAVTGINGDFFQWGDDPGGDPLGLMIHKGELLSAPAAGQRNVAVGWGPTRPFEVVRPKYGLHVIMADQTLEAEMLNGRVPKGGLGVSFDVAGDIYGDEPLTTVVVKLNGPKPALGGTVEATVEEVKLEVKRQPIAAQFAVLGASGEKGKILGKLHRGDKLTLKIDFSGMSAGITEAMGGYPVLLRNGAYVGPKQDEKSAKHPRTAIGVTADGLIWQVIIDGRQPMSIGSNFEETADVMKRLGCIHAVNLDGGGSSALRFLGVTINRPSGGVERAVANGIFGFGARPEIGPEFTIVGGAEVKVGQSITLRRSGSSTADDVIWAAQGGAWIDQDGVLRGVKAGPATVTALRKGRKVTLTVNVLP